MNAAGTGDVARLLEAALRLPDPGTRNVNPTPSAPSREDEVVLHYAPALQFLQAAGSPPAVIATEALRNDVQVHQTSDAAAEFARLVPAAAAALVAPMVHGSGHIGLVDTAHASYAIYNDGVTLAQTSMAASGYAAAFTQTADYARKIEVKPLRADCDWIRHKRFAGLGSAALHGVRRLWVCAPLLILLLSWLVAGLFAGIAMILFESSAGPVNTVFDFWGLGFLAIVGFGFYARVRNMRFRPGRLK